MKSSAVETAQAQILYIEDNEDDMIAVCDILDCAHVHVTWAGTLRNAREMMSDRTFDLILLDHVLPDGNGLSFIEEIWWNHSETPVILITGREDEALAVSAIKKGAVNFVLKAEIRRDLLPAVEMSLGRGMRKEPNGYFSIDWDITGVETDQLTPWLEPYHPPTPLPRGRFLERAQVFYRDVLTSIEESLLAVDADGVVTYANAAISKSLGLDETHMLGGGLEEIFDDETSKKLYDIRSKLKTRTSPGSFSIHGQYRRKGGAPADSVVPIWISGRSLHNPDGGYKSCLIGVAVLRGRDRA